MINEATKEWAKRNPHIADLLTGNVMCFRAHCNNLAEGLNFNLGSLIEVPLCKLYGGKG